MIRFKVTDFECVCGHTQAEAATLMFKEDGSTVFSCRVCRRWFQVVHHSEPIRGLIVDIATGETTEDDPVKPPIQ